MTDFLPLTNAFQHPEPSQLYHLKEMEAAYDKLTNHSLVMIVLCPMAEKENW